MRSNRAGGEFGQIDADQGERLLLALRISMRPQAACGHSADIDHGRQSAPGSAMREVGCLETSQGAKKA